MTRFVVTLLTIACASLPSGRQQAVVDNDVLVQSLQAMPWDSLCMSTQHIPCKVIRIDSVVRRAKLPIVESNDSVVTTIGENAREQLEAALGRRVERTKFSAQLPGADTVDVSVALFGVVRPDSMHLIMSIALPADSSGVYGHVQLRRTGESWKVLRRWILEG